MDIEAASDDDAFEDARDRVERPMWRLFTEYGKGQRLAFVVGLVSSIFARMLDLLPPLLLALAIDAVIQNEIAFSLWVVPDAWLPSEPAAGDVSVCELISS